jgi:hypothetical protein
MSAKTGITGQAIRHLSKSEIDQRIAGVVAEIAAATAPGDGDPLRPRFIAPAEFVRRVRPLLGRN